MMILKGNLIPTSLKTHCVVTAITAFMLGALCLCGAHKKHVNTL